MYVGLSGFCFTIFPVNEVLRVLRYEMCYLDPKVHQNAFGSWSP